MDGTMVYQTYDRESCPLFFFVTHRTTLPRLRTNHCRAKRSATVSIEQTTPTFENTHYAILLLIPLLDLPPKVTLATTGSGGGGSSSPQSTWRA